jgi:threonine/homoserine/homoserine lactone efflux protein
MWTQAMSSHIAQPLSVVLLLAAGTLSPGPNNFIVMRAAARGGLAAALPAIAAILLGSVVLLALAGSGAGAFARWPLLRQAIAIGGSLYLLWLGVSLMRTQAASDTVPVAPSGALALFAFQLLNPKAWTLALTLVAAQTTPRIFEILQRLAPLYVGIAAVSLALWAALGGVLRRTGLRPAQQCWMERAFGASLALGAVLLLL